MPPTATPTIDDLSRGADVDPPTLTAAPGLPARLAAGVASGVRRVGATVGALALLVAVALGVGSAAGCDFAGVAGATGLGGAVTTGFGRGTGFGVRRGGRGAGFGRSCHGWIRTGDRLWGRRGSRKWVVKRRPRRLPSRPQSRC